MSRVNISEIDVGDVGATAKANTTLEQWNSATANIDETNVREEGLDERNFAPGTVLYSVRSGASGDIVSSKTAYAEPPDVTLNTIIVDGDSVEFIVRCSCQVEVERIANTSTQASVGLRLAYHLGGGWNPLTSTERKFGYNPTQIFDEPYTLSSGVGVGPGLKLSSVYTVTTRFPLTLGVGTAVRFGLFSANLSGSASYTLSGIQLFAAAYRA